MPAMARIYGIRKVAAFETRNQCNQPSGQRRVGQTAKILTSFLNQATL